MYEEETPSVDISTVTELVHLSDSSENVMPTIFLSHGAPTLALDAGPTGEAWSRIGAKIIAEFGKPHGVVIMSPHWISRKLSVTAAAESSIIHDFYGFPEALYDMTYPCPSSPSIAEKIQSLLLIQGTVCQLDEKRGLDHGAWVPMRYMFPQADIPVIQVSMPYPQRPEHYVQIGRGLQTLSRQNILVVGSGSLTHNLSEFGGQPVNAPVQSYVEIFRSWMIDKLLSQDFLSLYSYREHAPNAVRAHPQDDHLMPLFFAIGAAETAEVAHLHSDITYGILAMDVFAIGSQSAKLN